MHTHTTAGMAVSSVEGGLRPTNFYACNFAGQIAYHDFEGVTVRSEEGARLIDNLGDKRVMFLRNHGIHVMSRTLPEAFIKHRSEEHTSELQSLMRISYAVFCLKKKNMSNNIKYNTNNNYLSSNT